jgi:hypothetical protein
VECVKIRRLKMSDQTGVAESAEILTIPIQLAGNSDKFSPSPIPGTIIKLASIGEQKNYCLMEEDEALRLLIAKLHSSYSPTLLAKCSWCWKIVSIHAVPLPIFLTAR